MEYLDEAKQKATEKEPNFMPVRSFEYAKVYALIAIAEQLQRLNDKLDSLTNYSGNAFFVENIGR